MELDNLPTKTPTIYIEPNISVYSSFDEAHKDLDLFGNSSFLSKKQVRFNDLLNLKRCFVVAEPGYGKTRLLWEMISKCCEIGKKGVYVDLKSIKRDMSIQDFILDIIKNSASTSHMTKDFNLKDSDNVMICFDALDEVAQDHFYELVEKINLFLAKFNKIQIFISCRWHYFEKYKNLFLGLNFNYSRLTEFSEQQVRDYLVKCKIEKKIIDKLIDILSAGKSCPIITTPRYLELLSVFIEEKDCQQVYSVSRTELFEFFIYRQLEIEDKRLNTQKRELVKRVLEKLALIMEIYQVNSITKDQLMTFFDDLSSDLKLNLLNQVPLEVFYDKTLLKDNGDTLEFHNTEFQEYLAAKEIMRFGRKDQVLFDLCIDQELNEIYLSWFNTVSFLVDLDISLLKPLLDIGIATKRAKLVGDEYFRLLTITNVDKLSIKERETIFIRVFDYYQETLMWLPNDIAERLVYYFDRTHRKILKAYVEKKYSKEEENNRVVLLSNVALLIRYLLRADKVSGKDKDYWINKMLVFANDKSSTEVLRRNALNSLSYSRKTLVLKYLKDIWNSSNQSLREIILVLCEKINPDQDISVQYFIKGMRRESTSIQARNGIYKVKNKRGIQAILESIIQDEKVMIAFLDYSNTFGNQDDALIENIVKVYDKKIEAQLKIIIQKAYESDRWYLADDSFLIRSITLILKQQDRKYLFELIKNIKKKLFPMEKLFSILLDKDLVDGFIKELSKKTDGKYFAARVLFKAKTTSGEDGEGIYEMGRKYLINEYSQIEREVNKNKQIPTEEKKLYDEFKKKLEPEPGKYFPDVFRYYLNNSKKIERLVTCSDKKRLSDLINNAILKHIDPAKQKLTSQRQAGGGYSYTTSSAMPIFSDAIRVMRELNLIIRDEYRQKVIDFIPFAYNDTLNGIFRLVKDIKFSEIRSVLNVYKNKKDDLWRHSPESFIQTCEKYNFQGALRILLQFIHYKDFDIHVRMQAIRVSVNLGMGHRDLNKLFKLFVGSNNEEVRLALIANKLLIERFHDDKAIRWRIKELQEKQLKIKDPLGFSRFDDEIGSDDFIKPLIALRDTIYLSDMLLILDNLFKLLEMGEEYKNYAEYLWRVIYGYVDNLKEYKSYGPLKKLEECLSKNGNKKGVNWVGYRFIQLKKTYLEFIGKPSSINDCIKKYNKLKTEQYLELTNPLRLKEEIIDVIDSEIKGWVSGEGKKLIINKDENVVQKILKMKFENSFLLRGFRKNEVLLIREPQLSDDKRVDFMISYGFVGPIVLELKLSSNQDLAAQKLTEKESYKNMVHYMKNYKAHFGIFLIINNQDWGQDKWEEKIRKIESAYQKIEHVEVKCVSI